VSAAPAARPHCPDCHAEVAADAVRCWLCHRKLVNDAEIVMAQIVPERTPLAPSQTLFAVLTALVGALVVVIGVGVARDAYLLIPYTLIVGFALAITSLHEVRARSAGRQVGWGERLLTFIISAHAVMAVLGVLLVAAVIAFVIFLFLVCSGALGK
jgi:hypothetical protein